MGKNMYQFYALLVRPFRDGHKRITVGPGFRVDGGDEADHKSAVAFSEHFLENLRTASPETVQEAFRIFKRTMEELP